MIPGPSLRVLGQVAFFGTMMTLMVPPSMPFIIFFLAFALLTIGALLGWAWGSAAMAAALRARDKAKLAAAIAGVRQRASQAPNPALYARLQIFNGVYLDVRSTAVFGVFLMLGVYFAAVIQIKVPKLKIFTVFMFLTLDVMCTYGPLFPTTRYTLGEYFMTPIGCSFAICLAAQILVFPETLAHAWQLRYIKMLGAVRQVVDLHSDALVQVAKHHDSFPEPSTQSHLDRPSGDFLQQTLAAEDEAAKTSAELLTDIKEDRVTIANHVMIINGMTAFLGMEFYRSFMNAHDMKVMFRKTRSVNLQLTLLTSFWRLIHHELGIADAHTFDDNWDPSKHEEGYDVDGQHGVEALPSKEKLKPIRLHETTTIHRVRP